MTTSELRTKAWSLGIYAEKMDKVDLIRAVQTKEGLGPCFRTPSAKTCREEDCIWKAASFA